MTKTVRALIQKFEKAINPILQWFTRMITHA